MSKQKNIPSDETLVSEALEDMAAFETIVERYEQKLLFYIQRISALSAEEAEEVLQDIFIKAWKNLNGFDTSLKFSSWIYRIAHNETISAFRKVKSRGQDTQIELDDSLFITEKTDFVAEFDDKLSNQQVAFILNQMPIKYREILVLKFLEDKSYEEISNILKKPSGTIATLIHRAKDSFRVEAQKANLSFDIK